MDKFELAQQMRKRVRARVEHLGFSSVDLQTFEKVCDLYEEAIDNKELENDNRN